MPTPRRESTHASRQSAFFDEITEVLTGRPGSDAGFLKDHFPRGDRLCVARRPTPRDLLSMLHVKLYVASAVSTALSTSALRSDAFLIRLRNTAAAGGAVRKHCDSLQRLTPRAAGDAPRETFVRELIPRRADWLARALLDVLPPNQCAAADDGTVRHTMLVLGERRKWHAMSGRSERSIRGGATVRVGHAAEAHTGRTHSL